MMTLGSTVARAARWASLVALVFIVSGCAGTAPSVAESLVEEAES